MEYYRVDRSHLLIFVIMFLIGSASSADMNLETKCNIETYQDGFRLTSPYLVLYLSGSQDGSYISQISQRSGSENLLPSAPEHKYLWRLHLEGETGSPISISSEDLKLASNIEHRSHGGKCLQLIWDRVKNLAISVEASFCVSPNDPLIRMRLSVQNDSAFTLAQVDFPMLSGIGPLSDDPSQDYLIWPKGTGELIPNPYQNPIPHAGRELHPYPSSIQSMQVTGLYGTRGGLYIAAYDPDCWSKYLRFEPSLTRRSLDFYLENYPQNIGSPGNDYQMHYDAVIGTFSGDWWVAAQMYRDWALTQNWCRSLNLIDDPSLSPHVRDVVLWFVLQSKPTVMEKQALQMQEYFGVPSIAHLYDWHKSPVTHTDPDYFPAKKGFEEAVRNLKQAGIEVMPYINVRMWDTNTPSFIEEEAYAGALRTTGSTIPTRSYNAHTFVTMCSSVPLWQEKMASVCETLTKEYGVGGVYLDQLSGPSTTPLCFARGHPHPPGGGNYWARGYLEMVEIIKRRMPDKNCFFTSEYFAEPYIAHVDGFLVWSCFTEYAIPFAQAVFSGRTIFWGRFFGTFFGEQPQPHLDRTDEGFYSKFADMMCNGIQLGWIYAWIMEDDVAEKREFIRNMARLYETGLKDAYLSGQLIKAPDLVGLDRTVEVIWPMYKNENKQLFPVLTGAWQFEDSRIKLLAINVTTDNQRFEIDIARWPPTTPWSQMSVQGQSTNTNPKVLHPKSGKLTLELDPRQAIVITLTPEGH